MHPVELSHLTFVRSRSLIRHDKQVLAWIAKCWKVVAGMAPSMTREGFTIFYRKLLMAMTVNWSDETFGDIAEALWQRDAGSFSDIDVNRFSCSLFSFTEMWVDSVELAEYVRVLNLIHDIFSDRIDKPVIHQTRPTSLEAFWAELANQRALEQQNLSFGKSISFDTERFRQVFGTSVTALATRQSTYVPKRRQSTESLRKAVAESRGTFPIGRYICRPRSCSTGKFEVAPSLAPISTLRPLTAKKITTDR